MKERESGDNFSQFFSETGCFKQRPQGNYFRSGQFDLIKNPVNLLTLSFSGREQPLMQKNSLVLLLKMLLNSWTSAKVLVSDKGRGIPGSQWCTLPSSHNADVSNTLLSGFNDCCRFTVGFNKHHQGVNIF